MIAIITAVAVVLFIASCISYHKIHDAAGDRLLFLSYAALIFAIALPLREWVA